MKEKDQYKNHVIITEEKLLRTRSYFTCQQCDKRYTKKGNLKVHIRVHAGETPYTCTQCGKGFYQQGSFIVHMRIHSGEKPFSCQQCGKCFTKKGTLKCHIEHSHQRKALHLPTAQENSHCKEALHVPSLWKNGAFHFSFRQHSCRFPF
uniref:C2H2-type domain-containing protein n=1 Tax=Cyprinus carpio TaxID=7962 RepID=A0A8C1WQ49_CYPCA